MQFLIKVIFDRDTAGAKNERVEHVTLKKSKLADHDPNQMHFAKDDEHWNSCRDSLYLALPFTKGKKSPFNEALLAMLASRHA